MSPRIKPHGRTRQTLGPGFGTLSHLIWAQRRAAKSVRLRLGFRENMGGQPHLLHVKTFLQLVVFPLGQQFLVCLEFVMKIGNIEGNSLRKHEAHVENK